MLSYNLIESHHAGVVVEIVPSGDPNHNYYAAWVAANCCYEKFPYSPWFGARVGNLSARVSDHIAFAGHDKTFEDGSRTRKEYIVMVDEPHGSPGNTRTIYHVFLVADNYEHPFEEACKLGYKMMKEHRS